MPLHRLTAPTYLGGVPATHDLLNDPAANGDAGDPANAAIGKKLTGPNEGTYFIAFGEDGTSEFGNRAHVALGENDDFLDDVVSGELPVPTNVDAVAAGPVTSVTLVGDVFVGKSGTANNQDERDRLISIVDSSTGDELIDSTGVKITCTAILDIPAGSNVVGTSATGFVLAPTLTFTPAIPTTTTYRIIYAKRGSLVSIVKTKVDLDAFTRLAIRGAHEMPAGTLRFIREASRRVGDSVVALAASIFETPGIGDNILGKSNAMFMDVDPDATQGASGTWAVRFDRTGTPKIMLIVNEGDGSEFGSSTWENLFERVQFKDINTDAAGFTADFIPLTSGLAASGDDMIRRFEVDPASPLSIVKRLNASEWTVVLGNGTTTFGDFNGAVALTDAVTAAIAAGVTALRLILKPGIYKVDNTVFTGMNTIVIEGTGQQDCIISSTATSPNAGMSFVQDQVVLLRNLSIIESAGSSVIPVRSTAAFLTMLDCVYDGTLEFQSVAASGTNHPYMVNAKRCLFTSSAVGVSPFVIRTVQGISTQHKGFVFEDCLIQPHIADTAALQIVDTGTGATFGTFFTGIIYKRCKIELGDTAESSGDMTGNSSVIDLVPSSSSSNVFIRSIEWQDCDVEVTGAVNDSKVLMYLRTSDGTASIGFTKIVISGGRWVLNAITELAPWYIGGEDESNDQPSFITELVVKDVSLGKLSSPAYGAQHAQVEIFTSGDIGAAFHFAAKRLVMKSVTLLSMSTTQDMADFCFISDDFDIDGIYFPTSIGSGGGVAPNHRIRVLHGFSLSSVRGGSIRNVHVLGISGAVVTLGGALEAVWAINTYVTSTIGALTFENCSAVGFTGGTAVDGFYLHPTTDQTGQMVFRNCIFRGNSGLGFTYLHDGVQTDGLKDIRFEGCTFSFNAVIGLSITGVQTGTPVASKITTVVNCRFESNTSYGFGYGPHVGGDDRLIMTGCSFEENNSSGDQMVVGGAAFLDGNLYSGTMYGNDCSGDGIRFFGAGTIVGALMVMSGIETRYDEAGAGGFILLTHRDAVSGQGMFNNNAQYIGT